MDIIKERKEWGKELNDLLAQRITEIINEEGYVLWEKINEECVEVQLFYNSLRKEFVEINKIGDWVVKKKREILRFD